MKALLHAGPSGRVPAPPEKRFLITRTDLAVTTQCQLRRVQLVCRSEVFVNAFVNLHIALEVLKPETQAKVRAALAAWRAEPEREGGAR